MDVSEFDWRGGKVVHWQLDWLDRQRPLATQTDALLEDLAQVEYGPKVVLDVGYYPQHTAHGEFVVSVIRDRRWEAPVLRVACADLDSLSAAILKAIDEALRTARAAQS